MDLKLNRQGELNDTARNCRWVRYSSGMPWTGHAQQPAKTRTIGVLGASSPDTAGPWIAAFVGRLRQLGWTEGKNVIIEYRWAEARSERYNEIAAELASQNVDVIVTWASAPVLAAKRTTTTIPIVFAAQMDPVGAGVVASLARPGGNITGMSIQQTDTAGKRIELLRAIEVRQADEIFSSIESLKDRADALYVATPTLPSLTPNGHPIFAGAVVDFPPFITRRPVAKW